MANLISNVKVTLANVIAIHIEYAVECARVDGCGHWYINRFIFTPYYSKKVQVKKADTR